MRDDGLIEELLAIGRVNRGEVLRVAVADRLGPRDVKGLQAIARATWDAGMLCARIAVEEHGRGLEGSRTPPAELCDTLRDVHSEALQQAPDPMEEIPGALLDPDSKSRDASWVQADDARLRACAQAAMENWEALQRIEDVCFEGAISRALAAEGVGELCAGRGALLPDVGPLRGRTPLITAIAIAKRLADSHPCAARWRIARLSRLSGRSHPDLQSGRQLVQIRGLLATGRVAQALAAASELGATKAPAHDKTEAILCNALAHLAGQGAALGIHWAVAAWTRALALRDRRRAGRSLLVAGRAAFMLGKAGSARVLLEATAATAESLGDTGSTAEALGWMAVVLCFGGEREAAWDLHEKALQLNRQSGHRRQEAAVLGRQGVQHWQCGRFIDARETFEQVLEIFRELGDRQCESSALTNLGILHRETGSPFVARDMFQGALHIDRDRGDPLAEAANRTNLGTALRETGFHVQALEELEKALAIFRAHGSRSGEANALLNLGIVHAETGSWKRARTTIEEALAMFRKLGDSRSEAWALGNLAETYGAVGLKTEALVQYRQSLAVCRRNEDRRGEAIALLNLGLLAIEGAPETPATLHLEAALRVFVALGDSWMEAQARLALAKAWLDREQPGAAHDQAQTAALVFDDWSDTRNLWRAKHYLARSLEMLEREQDAHSAYESALGSLEDWVGAIQSDPRRATILDQATTLFADAIQFLLGQGHRGISAIVEAYELAERGAGRSLLELMRPRGHRRAVPHEFADRLSHLQVRLRALQDALLQERSRSPATSATMERMHEELETVRAEHGALCDDIALRFPVLAAEERVLPPLDLESVQERILVESDVALLHYFLTDKETFLWIVHQDRIVLERLGLGRAVLEELLQSVLDPLRSYGATRDPLDLLGLAPADLLSVGSALLGPALPHLHRTKRLLIVRAGSLHELPFEMLMLPRSTSADSNTENGPSVDSMYLVERFEVVYGPSSTLLDPTLFASENGEDGEGRRRASFGLPPHGSPPLDLEVLAIGDPAYQVDNPGRAALRAPNKGAGFAMLPGTRREIDALRRHFPGASAFTRGSARESAYRRHAPQADLIHLGCHGYLDADDPGLSGVVLSPGKESGEDAFLQAYEIVNIHLNRGPLVVVSACEVAAGPLSSVEGLLGLTRAFAVAGASCVVASAWPLDDQATANLIVCFYEHLAGGADPPAALAAAKRAIIGSARDQDSGLPSLHIPPGHPALWAGLVAHGTGVRLPS